MKNRISKTLSLLLITTLVTAALPLAAVTVSAATNVRNESALVKAINKGNDVTLKADITLGETLTIPEGISVTIDLNGYSLDRGLDFEAQEDGSVILVEEGAELSIKDNSGTDSGSVTGGASFLGGGICNYGTLTVNGGTITGNCAYDETDGMGGGIYNEGELTLLGGVITENEANYGGGIYNMTGSTVTIQQSTYLKEVGVNSTEIIMNVKITANYAEDGKSHGICNSGTVNIQDSPNISGNEDNDIYCAYGKKLSITGALDIKKPIGIQAAGTNPTFTAGYATYLSGSPKDYFTSTNGNAALQLDSSGEAMLLTDSKTKVVVYENSTMTASKEYDSFSDAWSAARSYAQNDSGKTRVEVTLGSDWSGDEKLKVDKGYYIVLDLNGHYIKRNRNGSMTDDGYVFRAESLAHFVIKDSNPDSKGYDGLKGGVITGGCSTSDCGCIYLNGSSRLEMTGGTIYQCKTNNDGGAIYVDPSEEKQVSLSNCSIRDCTANGSGGAVYVAGKLKSFSMDNVTVRGCSAGEYGGAVYFDESEKGTVRISNSMFNGNYAQCGGALSLLNVRNRKGYDAYFDFIADNCVFYNNYIRYTGELRHYYTIRDNEFSTSVNKCYGSAVFFSEYDNVTDTTSTVTYESLYPVLFRDCTFKNNWGKAEENDTYYHRYGSPFYVRQDGLVLDSCTITDNSDGESPVYLSAHCDISVKGETVIKDNSNGGIYLDGIGNAATMIYDAGLEEGSYIEVQNSGRSRLDNTYVKNTSEYRSGYFHYADGDFVFEETSTETAQMATASIFGSGSWVALVVLIAIAAAAVIITLVIVSKKRKGGA